MRVGRCVGASAPSACLRAWPSARLRVSAYFVIQCYSSVCIYIYIYIYVFVLVCTPASLHVSTSTRRRLCFASLRHWGSTDKPREYWVALPV